MLQKVGGKTIHPFTVADLLLEVVMCEFCPLQNYGGCFETSSDTFSKDFIILRTMTVLSS